MEDSHRIRAALSLLNIKPGLLLRHYDFEETGRYRKVLFVVLFHLSLFLHPVRDNTLVNFGSDRKNNYKNGKKWTQNDK